MKVLKNIKDFLEGLYVGLNMATDYTWEKYDCKIPKWVCMTICLASVPFNCVYMLLMYIFKKDELDENIKEIEEIAEIYLENKEA